MCGLTMEKEREKLHLNTSTVSGSEVCDDRFPHPSRKKRAASGCRFFFIKSGLFPAKDRLGSFALFWKAVRDKLTKSSVPLSALLGQQKTKGTNI